MQSCIGTYSNGMAISLHVYRVTLVFSSGFDIEPRALSSRKATQLQACPTRPTLSHILPQKGDIRGQREGAAGAMPGGAAVGELLGSSQEALSQSVHPKLKNGEGFGVLIIPG